MKKLLMSLLVGMSLFAGNSFAGGWVKGAKIKAVYVYDENFIIATSSMKNSCGGERFAFPNNNQNLSVLMTAFTSKSNVEILDLQRARETASGCDDYKINEALYIVLGEQ